MSALVFEFKSKNQMGNGKPAIEEEKLTEAEILEQLDELREKRRIIRNDLDKLQRCIDWQYKYQKLHKKKQRYSYMGNQRKVKKILKELVAVSAKIWGLREKQTDFEDQSFR